MRAYRAATLKQVEKTMLIAQIKSDKSVGPQESQQDQGQEAINVGTSALPVGTFNHDTGEWEQPNETIAEGVALPFEGTWQEGPTGHDGEWEGYDAAGEWVGHAAASPVAYEYDVQGNQTNAEGEAQGMEVSPGVTNEFDGSNHQHQQLLHHSQSDGAVLHAHGHETEGNHMPRASTMANGEYQEVLQDQEFATGAPMHQPYDHMLSVDMQQHQQQHEQYEQQDAGHHYGDQQAPEGQQVDEQQHQGYDSHQEGYYNQEVQTSAQQEGMPAQHEQAYEQGGVEQHAEEYSLGVQASADQEGVPVQGEQAYDQGDAEQQAAEQSQAPSGDGQQEA
jgi:hypothetical protein